jgi:acyl-CoA synthetase (AMP-forming)/AMP-acid ligase II
MKTKTNDREPQNFAQLLQKRAKETPDALAYRFVGDNGSEIGITYGEFDTRARSVAAKIYSAQRTTQKPVLLLFAPGIEYLAALFGCFYARTAAVPAFPPKMSRTLPRLAALLA